VSSVVSAGFPFVVKVEALPPLWRGSVVFGEAQCGTCCHVLCVSWVENEILYIGGYLVKWRGYSDDHNTWEPASMVAALDALKEYLAYRTRTPNPVAPLAQ
jgi:hypothetical protein